MPIIPTFSNGLQLIGFVSVLIYMAYLKKMGSDEARVIKANLDIAAQKTAKKIDENNTKTDSLHGMLNSRLDEFRSLIEEKSKLDMAANRREFEALLLSSKVEFERRIKSLENTIEAQKALIPIPPTISPIPPVDPDKRLNEVRGEQ